MPDRIDQKRESAHPAKATLVLLIGTVALVVLLAVLSTFR
jgi:hypothetical protein